MTAPEIVVSLSDLKKLSRMLEATGGRDQACADHLAQELVRARVVADGEVPPDVVTMHSRFRYVDAASGESRVVTLVYPREADLKAGKLSVLAPVGCALLGLAVGQSIDWPLPNGKVRSLGVAEVLYQPERAGDLPEPDSPSQDGGA